MAELSTTDFMLQPQNKVSKYKGSTTYHVTVVGPDFIVKCSSAPIGRPENVKDTSVAVKEQ